MLLSMTTSGMIPVFVLSLFVLISNLPYSKATFGGNCTNDDNCTIPHETCSNNTGTPGVCVCAVGFYYNNGSGSRGLCEQKVGLGSNCTQPDACNDTNAVCTSGKCACGTGYYDSNGVNTLDGTCTSKVGLGSNCTQPDACNDTNAACTSGKCACGTEYYDSNGVNTLNGTCTLKVGLGSNCTQPDACNDTNAACTSGKCVCGTGYYDSNGVNTLDGTCTPSRACGTGYYDSNGVNTSDGTCTPKIGLGLNCSQPDACGTDYAFCGISPTNVDICVCSKDYYDSNGITLGGTCNNVTNLKVQAISYGAITVDSISISWTPPADTLAVNYYVVEHRSADSTDSSAQNVTNNSTILRSLSPGNRYYINVTSVNTQTSSSLRATSVTEYQVSAPDPPGNIQCSDRNDRDIQLMWNAPVNPNGDLRHYIINVKRTSPSPGDAYNVTTATADLHYKVENLSEGSFHTFQVYTVNEQYESASASEKQSCETRPRMSEPPTYLKEHLVTSRSFTISWDQPKNVFGELVGYILIINNTETKDCVVEEFTNCTTGCTNAFPNQTVVSPTCNQTTKYKSIDKTKLHRTRNFTASVGTFDPYTAYKVIVVAVNQGGKGNSNDITVITLEEVPQKPYNIQVIDLQATNATVGWSIGGPRPGNTTYTIMVTGNSPAENMTHTVSGFSNTSFNITGLQEYWNYSLTVTASTKQGSNLSDSVMLKTKVAPAGKVSKFTVEEGSGSDKYVTAIVSWSLPGILERNGPIMGFIVQQEEMVNGTFSEINKRNVTSVIDESNRYNIDFQVQREQLYIFKIFAYNGFDGDVSSMNFSASPVQTSSPAGALAGGITGGAVALILIVVIIVLWRRKSNKRKMARRSSDDATESNMKNLRTIRKERPINLATFAEYVTDHHKDSNMKFAEEYQDLKTLSLKHPHEAAEIEENCLKNRFVNILPFDHSRVKLLPVDGLPGSDYINASFLPVKCEVYMPLELKDPKQYGDLVVECLTYSSMNSFEYRTLKIRLGEEEKTIKHFHFLSWRDYSANVEFETMIDFIKKVHNFIQPPDLEGPVIVHCSAGVGRTGTYITIDQVIQHIDKYGPDSTVDIFNFVLKMRENRTNMVQTEQQYIFIHDCIKEYLDRFKTYENQAFSNEDENLYQNTEAAELYQNVNFNSIQKTEL